MNNKRQEERDLISLIDDKVQEYIDDRHIWDGPVFIWVNTQPAEVHLGKLTDSFPGVREHVTEFIVNDEGNNPIPDYDKMAEFAYYWFDFKRR
jgi:hypothetical protein